jgi:DNA-binding CsgD family transcriptional regulator
MIAANASRPAAASLAELDRLPSRRFFPDHLARPTRRCWLPRRTASVPGCCLARHRSRPRCSTRQHLTRTTPRPLSAAGQAEGEAAAVSGPGSLTPTERRVAELAASGLTNRQLAEALFVTVKTVETHLARAYQKLGTRSRAELTRLIGESSPDYEPG